MLINHLLTHKNLTQKYQGDSLLNYQQAAALVGVDVACLRYHVTRKNIEPVCREKQYPNSNTTVFLFSKEDVLAFKENQQLWAKRKNKPENNHE